MLSLPLFSRKKGTYLVSRAARLCALQAPGQGVSAQVSCKAWPRLKSSRAAPPSLRPTRSCTWPDRGPAPPGCLDELRWSGTGTGTGGGREALGWEPGLVGAGARLWGGGLPSFLLPIPSQAPCAGRGGLLLGQGPVRAKVPSRHSLHRCASQGRDLGLAGLADNEAQALALGRQEASEQETLPTGPSSALWAGSHCSRHRVGAHWK